MSCNCESQLEPIMKLLEEMRAEIGFVKTKCVRIEKEILGITAESELNAEALMETTTVRHIVEKMAFQINKTTEDGNEASATAIRHREMKAATKDLNHKFATIQKIKDLKLKYDVLTPNTFCMEFSYFRAELLSQTEKMLLNNGFSSSITHDVVEQVARANDLDYLYGVHLADRCREMGTVIRQRYSEAVHAYAKSAIEKMSGSPEIGLRVSAEFLNKFKLCEKSFGSFQKELLNEFSPINEQIEANRGLLVRLTEVYRQTVPRGYPFTSDEDKFVTTLQSEIIVSDPKFPLFSERLRQNIQGIREL